MALWRAQQATKLGAGMQLKRKTVFLSADHLEEQADARMRQAEQLPAGEAKQNALQATAQLRSYAEMKRLLQRPKGGSR